MGILIDLGLSKGNNVITTRVMIKTLMINALLLIVQPGWAEDILKLSTTTSTENSGLLAVLHPTFEKQNNIRVDIIAVGSCKALKIGGNGDVDVVFVHAPAAELTLC